MLECWLHDAWVSCKTVEEIVWLTKLVALIGWLAAVDHILCAVSRTSDTFPVTLRRIFNTCLKNCRLLFSAVISEYFSKNCMIISVVAAKIWYLKNVRFLLGHPVQSGPTDDKFLWKKYFLVTVIIGQMSLNKWPFACIPHSYLQIIV